MRNYLCADCGPVTLREEIRVMGNNGINIAGFSGVIALGIKFTKNWYLQQIQNRILARQKITNELKLLKTRIQPGFLFKSLQALYHEISINKKQAAEMLLKFSELLSYMLYECDDDFVLMQRELFIIGEFIKLEKMMHGTKFIIADNITGDANKKYIPSFTLLSLIQNCVTALHDNPDKEQHYFTVDIKAETNTLYCKIDVQNGDAAAIKDVYAIIINTFVDRLETFYKNNYTLESSGKEQGAYIITLTLLLADNFSPDKTEEIPGTKYAHAHV